MDDATGVGGPQGAQQVAAQPHRFLLRQRPALQPLRHRIPRDVVHHVVEQTVDLTGAVHRYDVGVAEAGQDTGFTQEPLGGGRGGELGPQDLDGPVALERHVAGEEDGAHTAGTELALDFVLRGQCGPQTLEKRT